MSKKSNRGFTILEIMIATTLFAALVGVLLSAFVSANQAVVLNDSKSIESNLAREGLESLYNAVRQDQWADTTNPLHPDAVIPEEQVSIDGVIYKRSFDADAVAGMNYRKVKMTVKK